MPKSFEPENTKDRLYIRANYCSVSLADLIDQIRSHFGVENVDDFQISAEHIQTECIGYDLYDAGDWTNFIVVERGS